MMTVRNVLLAFFTLSLLASLTKGAPHFVGNLPNIAHGISGKLYMGQRETRGQYYFRIENFNYDAGGPDVFIYVLDTNGKGHIIPITPQSPKFRFGGPHYINVLLEVNIPASLQENASTFRIFSIWCRLFHVDFSRLSIPANTVSSIVPDIELVKPSPSKSYSGILESTFTTELASTQSASQAPSPTAAPTATPGSYQNCEALSDDLQVSWTLDRCSDSVRVKLCGCIKDSEYMAFGISGSTSTFQMLNADVVVAWHSQASTGAVDYHLSGYAQCRPGVAGGISAACPDSVQGGVNNTQLVQASLDGNIRCVEFRRPANASDQYDRSMRSTAQIVWAIGPRDVTSNYPYKHFQRTTTCKSLSFDRASANNCPMMKCTAGQVCPWKEKVIDARGRDETFVARIGQAGAFRGYAGITGNSGWGITWYINNTIIPILRVSRGNTYTFVVYGGRNPLDASNYHPFYLTQSGRGGRLANSLSAQASESVVAGFSSSSNQPTAVGDLCYYEETSPASGNVAQNCSTNFSDYFSTLVERQLCDSMNPGVLEWTPNRSTPDLLYYQCATHASLGWKIQVEDIRNVCSRRFCKRRTRGTICRVPSSTPGDVSGCTGDFDLTTCGACYYSEEHRDHPKPRSCRLQCNGEVHEDCIRSYGQCVRAKSIRRDGKPSQKLKRQSRFKCFRPIC